MYIIAGLGNPGEKYKNTRHNIGFMVVEAFAEKFQVEGKFSQKFNAIVGKGSVNGEEVILVQPLTFMNLSGSSISAILNWYKVNASNLVVVYDDISIDFGKIRVRPSGSAGGHNGMKSIIQSCGSDVFPRLRVGIGPNPGEHLWKSFVLEKFSKSEKSNLDEIIKTSVNALEDCILKGVDFTRNKYNGMNIL